MVRYLPPYASLTPGPRLARNALSNSWSPRRKAGGYGAPVVADALGSPAGPQHATANAKIRPCIASSGRSASERRLQQPRTVHGRGGNAAETNVFGSIGAFPSGF